MLPAVTAPALKLYFRMYFTLIEQFNTWTPDTVSGQIPPDHCSVL